jgi:hypothetical protein
VPHFLKIGTDSPDVQYQADQASQSDNGCIGVKIKPLPGNHPDLKKNEPDQQASEDLLFVGKVEYQQNKRGIDQIIQESDFITCKPVPVPVKNLRRVGDAID